MMTLNDKIDLMENSSMIRLIIYKEILEKFLSLRFVLSLLLIICLFAVSGFVFVGKYRQQSQYYWEETNKNLSVLSERSKQLYQLAFYEQTVWRQPKPLSLCSEGFEKYLPNHFKFNVFKMDFPKVRSQQNILLSRFCDIDWVFIISLALSFVALVLTYDSICGEKEAGTLRLMLANTIPRYKVLLGKYFGAMFTLAIPLIVGLLVSLIIVILSEHVAIDAAAWLKISAIILLSLLYLSIFVFLAIFVSSRTAHSANCMVILLLLWVGLVIVLPSFGRVISDMFCKTPTRVELDRKLNEVGKQMMDAAFSGKFGNNPGYHSSNPNDSHNNPTATDRFYNAVTNRTNQVRDGYYNEMMAPAIIGRRFTRISPMVLYRCVCEIITGTGVGRLSSLRQEIKRYQENLKQFVLSKDQEDTESLHLLFDIEGAVRDWGTISKKPVDFDTVPKFQERDLALRESLQLAIWDIGLLVLFNLVFFAAAFVSFLRYDVR